MIGLSAWTLVTVIGYVLGAGWEYSGDTGPEFWKNDYPLCGEPNQSPIDIVPATTTYNADLNFVQTHNYNQSGTANYTLGNNGHTAVVVFSGTNYIINQGGLPNDFHAAQMHFHWGSSSGQGSEHHIGDQASPMELHIVHWNGAMGNFSNAVAQEGGLAVLGFLYEIQSDDNPAYTDLLSQFSSITEKGNQSMIAPFPLTPLLLSEDKRGHYYRYPGSLTTPGCYESVIWTVFKETIKISETQMDAFRNIYTMFDNNRVRMVDNDRPIQPLNGRTVYTTNSNDPAPASHQGKLTASVATVAILALVRLYL